MSGIDATHQSIDAVIRMIGGYWPPLGGLARVIEEAGEMAEAMAACNTEGVLQEAADILVATAALANQYCAWPVGATREAASSVVWLNLLSSIGRLSRIVNLVEGIKPAKPGEDIPELAGVIGNIYADAAAISCVSTAFLFEQALELGRAKVHRDRGRFQARLDPVTALCLDTFRQKLSMTDADLPRHAYRLWGEDLAEGLLRPSQDSLHRFLTLDTLHPMDAYVVGPITSSCNEPHDGLADISERLAQRIQAIPQAAQAKPPVGTLIFRPDGDQTSEAYILVFGRGAFYRTLDDWLRNNKSRELHKMYWRRQIQHPL